MVTYRNVETGKTDSYSTPVRLLERSPRWERVGDTPPPPASAPKSPPRRSPKSAPDP